MRSPGNGDPSVTPSGHRALRPELLESIARVQAPFGFLSVYVGTDAADPDRARIELKNQCARIEEAHAGSESAPQLHDAMERLRNGVQNALGAGFAIGGFIPVGGAESDSIWVDLPGGGQTLVAHDAAPYTLPLLAMIERFAASGVVTVAHDQLAVHESARGALDELARQSVDVDTATWRDTNGPSNAVASGRPGGAGVGAMSSGSSGDAYEDKLDRAGVAELAGVAAPLLDRLVAERGWERLIWFGDAAIIGSVRASLHRDDLVHIDAGGAQVLSESRDELAARVDLARRERWTHDSEALIRTLRERRPADRVESVQEASTLAREGRVADLAVMVPDATSQEPGDHDINALLGDVLRHGGHVRALDAPGDDAMSIVASLRW